MKNLMTFNTTVQNAFDCDQSKFASFNQLMLDYAHDELADGITKKDANAKISEVFRAIIGCNEKSSVKEIRRGIRRNQPAVFDILEDFVQNLLVTGWQADPFFNEYVDIRNLALGDKN